MESNGNEKNQSVESKDPNPFRHRVCGEPSVDGRSLNEKIPMLNPTREHWIGALTSLALSVAFQSGRGVLYVVGGQNGSKVVRVNRGYLLRIDGAAVLKVKHGVGRSRSQSPHTSLDAW